MLRLKFTYSLAEISTGINVSLDNLVKVHSIFWKLLTFNSFLKFSYVSLFDYMLGGEHTFLVKYRLLI